MKPRLDKFYTKDNVVATCLQHVPTGYSYVEPSAGSGAFSSQLTPCQAFDLEPTGVGITQADFLKDELDIDEGCVFVGNPPYGRNSSLAVRFFNRAASYSPHAICMVFPRTFMKDGVKNKLDLNYHLVHEIELPKNSFISTCGEREFDVPSVFQVWELSNVKREPVIYSKDNELVSFVKFEDGYDFAFRRAGSRAGDIVDKHEKATGGWYYLRAKHKDAREILESIDWSDIKRRSVGQPSISRPEMTQLIERRDR